MGENIIRESNSSSSLGTETGTGSDTVFRTRQEPTPEPSVSPKTSIPDDQQPNRVPEPLGGDAMSDAPPKELGIWEGVKNKKYVNEYFNTHNIGHEFEWKMPLAKIDKYIKGEIESREYEKTTENYEKVLREIESEIGSGQLQLSKRLQKIVGYLNVLKKQRQIRELKQKYVRMAKESDTE